MTDAPEDVRQSGGIGPTIAAVVAAVLMVAVGVVYLVSGLVMPAWAVAAMIVLWLVLVWYGVRLVYSRSYLVLAIPVVAAVIWLLVVWLGEVLLGWTA